MKRQTYLTTYNLTFLYSKNSSMSWGETNSLGKSLQHTHPVKKYLLKMLYSVVAARCKDDQHRNILAFTTVHSNRRSNPWVLTWCSCKWARPKSKGKRREAQRRAAEECPGLLRKEPTQASSHPCISDFMLVAWMQWWWECLYHGCKYLQTLHPILTLKGKVFNYMLKAWHVRSHCDGQKTLSWFPTIIWKFPNSGKTLLPPLRNKEHLIR